MGEEGAVSFVAARVDVTHTLSAHPKTGDGMGVVEGSPTAGSRPLWLLTVSASKALSHCGC